MTTNPSTPVSPSRTSLSKRLCALVTRGRVPTRVGLVFIALVLIVGCGDNGSSDTFCESICNELVDCRDSIEFEECDVACEGELDEAMEVGGSDCVDAREDYLDCAVNDLCEDLDFEDSSCKEEAIEGEIESCGEALGEF